jgi:crotonobetainyl-CoA:carnitine CoA-transferase CaiB-like acyl-CoA transferase
MHADPQTLAREMVTTVRHPVAGLVQTIGSPVKFSGTPAEIDQAAPLLGQHSYEILAEHGYSKDDIDVLISQGAVGAPAQQAA